MYLVFTWIFGAQRRVAPGLLFPFKLSCHLLFGPHFPSSQIFPSITTFLHHRPGFSLWQVPPISFLYPIHTFLSPSYRPALSLWQVPPISFLYLLHTSLFFFILQAWLVIVAGPAFFLLSSLHLPLSLSLKSPRLSLWQVPPFHPPSSLSYPLYSLPLPPIDPACHCGRSIQFLDFTSHS